MEHCTITGNSAYYGGGVYCRAGYPTLSNCVISDNGDGGQGAGVYCTFFNGTKFVDCDISENSDCALGGGVYCTRFSTPVLLRCRITGNSSRASGGGVYCTSSDPILTNCVIAGNTSEKGGGVYCGGDSTPELRNCTVTDNVAELGGGIHCRASWSPELSGCILWGDTPDEIYDDPDYPGEPVVVYSDVQGSYPGQGNLDADPAFGSYGGHDYVLWLDSPCIDAGDPGDTDAVNWSAIHLAYGRVNGPRADMGAYGGPGTRD